RKGRFRSREGKVSRASLHGKDPWPFALAARRRRTRADRFSCRASGNGRRRGGACGFLPPRAPDGFAGHGRDGGRSRGGRLVLDVALAEVRGGSGPGGCLYGSCGGQPVDLHWGGSRTLLENGRSVRHGCVVAPTSQPFSRSGSLKTSHA